MQGEKKNIMQSIISKFLILYLIANLALYFLSSLGPCPPHPSLSLIHCDMCFLIFQRPSSKGLVAILEEYEDIKDTGENILIFCLLFKYIDEYKGN